MSFFKLFPLLASISLGACSAAEEAKRVDLLVVSDGDGFEIVTTDLGYEVELTRASVAADDLQFASAGEQHATLLRQLSDWVVPVANAHPGHFQGGEVTGELPGHFVLRFEPGERHEVGTATLLAGTYQSVNLTLASADDADVEAGDPVLGHTAYLGGAAASAAGNVEFEVLLDSPAGRQLVGIPFEEEVSESTDNALALRLSPHDPLESDTLFDGVDFVGLDSDADGAVLIEPASADPAIVDAYNQILRAFQSHDHFIVQPED